MAIDIQDQRLWSRQEIPTSAATILGVYFINLASTLNTSIFRSSLHDPHMFNYVVSRAPSLICVVLSLWVASSTVAICCGHRWLSDSLTAWPLLKTVVNDDAMHECSTASFGRRTPPRSTHGQLLRIPCVHRGRRRCFFRAFDTVRDQPQHPRPTESVLRSWAVHVHLDLANPVTFFFGDFIRDSVSVSRT